MPFSVSGLGAGHGLACARNPGLGAGDSHLSPASHGGIVDLAGWFRPAAAASRVQ
jgi:hypothetical protein